MRSSLSLYVLFMLLLSLQARAQSVVQGWAGKIGGASADAGNAIATDASGNVYVTGNFNGSGVSFNISGSGTPLTSQSMDAFILKLDGSGATSWAKNIGGTGLDYGRAVGVDKDGNVYVAGTFTTAADVLGTNLTSAGGVDIFVCKINSNGTLAWAQRAGGGGADALWDMAVDHNTGSVYITGSFFQHATAADFGAVTLTSNGSTDIFISKLDRDGNFKWSQSFGSTGVDAGYGVALQPGSNALVLTGNFANSVTFASGNTLTSDGLSDIFVYKGDTNGNFTWVKKLGGKKNDQPRDVAVDVAGNIYTTGYFSDSANFDPNGTYMVHGQVFYQDIFVSKLNAGGNFVYASGFGGPMMASGSEEPPKFFGEAIAVDAAGKAYVTGRIDYANVDFAPGAEVYYAKSKGNSDIFVMGLTDAGNLSWVRTFGAAGNDVGNGIALDDAGNIYTTGAFFNTIVFNPDPQAAAPSLASAGSSDIFVHKIGQASCVSSLSPVIDEKACDTFHYGGVAYTTSQVFSTLAVNAAGCDSMITINLTVGKSSAPSLYTPPMQCDTFDFFGTVYTQSGQYNQVLTNVAGCDSLVTIDLTIVHSSWDTLFRVANCDGYLYDTITYLETGFYVHTYPHSNSCDSNVVLALTIDTVNISVTVDQNKLVAGESNAIWQWLDCDDQYAAISGADSQSFTPQKSGNYAVAVTVDGCTDTSACIAYSIATDAVADVAGAAVWRLYPNPAHTTLHIDISVAGKLAIYGLDSRLVSETVLYPGTNFISIAAIQQGMYTARITDVSGQTLGVQKVVKIDR